MVLSLSDAMDFIRPEIAGHQQRVAYIVMKLAEKMEFSDKDRLALLLAATLHDIAMIRTDRRVQAIRDNKMYLVRWHAKLGYELLKDIDIFSQAASNILHHHTPWSMSAYREADDRMAFLGGQIIALGDQVEIAIDRDRNILDQSSSIASRFDEFRMKTIHPDCLKAFQGLAKTEAFWLDCVSNRVQSLLLQSIGDFKTDISSSVITDISEIFARVVDSMNPWTAKHSSGVTATALALSQLMRFSAREQLYMKVAGLLHDLGKLSVPAEVLDKPSKLNSEEWATIKGHTYHTYRLLEEIGFPRQIAEWAAFHHERLDGKGYPFHHCGDDLTLGSRIMAVADIYTALTENRPYRQGDTGEKAVSRLFVMARNGAIDMDVVIVLADNLDFVDSCRRTAQTEYAERQDQISRTLFGEMSGEDSSVMEEMTC